MSIVEIITYVPVISLIIWIFWLSDREIKKSLEQSCAMEKELAKERRNIKIGMREDDYKHKEDRFHRIKELTKAADFGRAYQGLFHEIMTPLTTIALHTEELKKVGVGEATDRAVSYIKDIRSALSHEEPERMCVIKEELHHVTKLLTYRARESHILIHEEINDHCSWYGNPMKLRQIFSNLISNAIDAFEGIDRTGRKIIISLKEKEENTVIEIKDNGSGISGENIAKIFNPFFSTKSPDKGTGIGLMMVKSIVEEDMGGRIEVQSKEGEGSAFTITFPSHTRG